MEHALEEATPMRYRRATAMLALALGMSALALVVLAGPAYRLHLLALGSAFSLLRWGVWAGLAAVVIGVSAPGWCVPARVVPASASRSPG